MHEFLFPKHHPKSSSILPECFMCRELQYIVEYEIPDLWVKRLCSHWQALINNHSLFTPTTLKLLLRGKQYLFPRQGAQSSLSPPLTPYSQSRSRAQPLPTTRWEGAPNLQRKQWRLNNTFVSAISSLSVNTPQGGTTGRTRGVPTVQCQKHSKGH